jgi:hypothetical protein
MAKEAGISSGCVPKESSMDINRVRAFEVMEEIQKDKRAEYRKIKPDKVHERHMADLLVAVMRVYKESYFGGVVVH